MGYPLSNNHGSAHFGVPRKEKSPKLSCQLPNRWLEGGEMSGFVVRDVFFVGERVGFSPDAYAACLEEGFP